MQEYTTDVNVSSKHIHHFIQWKNIKFQTMVSNGPWPYIDGLLQNCGISTANEMEILQSWTKPSI